MSTYYNREQLIEEIKPWWTGRGWKLSTIQQKNLNQLQGIRNTMYKQLAQEIELSHKDNVFISKTAQLSLF